MAVTKRTTKKTKTTATKKKKAPARQSRRDSHIDFKCILSRCTPSKRIARIGKVGDLVELEAKRTDAEIEFLAGSPFEETHISLVDRKPITMEIIESGTFEYEVSCTACSRRLSAPPSMIVD